MTTGSVLHVEDLSYRYPPPQEEYGLDLAALDVCRGQAILLSGPSGCGKSTLARCIAGLIPHLYHGRLGGEVRVDGLRTDETPLWRLAEQAGMVFQDPASQMIAASVEDEIVFGLENLGLPRAEVRARLDDATERFDLEPLCDRAPLTLSGGEQQKLALAAVMARRPSLLVLDEPLSMLDPGAVGDLVRHLGELVRAGSTVVICEHRVAPLRLIPGIRVVDLVEGCAEGTYDLPQDGPPLDEVRPFALQAAGLGVELGGRDVLHDLSFTIESGQVVAIVGRNGVGKTTLLRALAGLQRHGGEVSVDGRQADLALVFQNPNLQLFSASVRDEILYKVAEPHPGLYRWLVRSLGLDGYEDTPPLLLSEGEKKRVALAVALMCGARDGLLLDEPALGQDAAHKEQLLRVARALAAAGRLVVMTTHDLPLAAQADRLILLGDEGFIADGPPAQVLRDRAAWDRAGLSVPAWVLEAA